jgi:putative exosortase-associated protein (TIGR04073 family)
MLAPGLTVHAQGYDPDEEIVPPTGIEKKLTKLGRGLSNVMLGWAEIPVTFYNKVNEGKPLGYLVGVVPVLGTARALIRTTTGVYEMVTFNYSDLEVNFDPILEPEYIF